MKVWLRSCCFLLLIVISIFNKCTILDMLKITKSTDDYPSFYSFLISSTQPPAFSQILPDLKMQKLAMGLPPLLFWRERY
jgi:hypothetical protein